ncbi:hypothetical protein BV20DRAFT_1125569 [Pilatotrama ljubarskyi]|nr:hypothetical protein BV20DRAFT_1125569 [Pilatotrama ljubarskyi]
MPAASTSSAPSDADSWGGPATATALARTHPLAHTSAVTTVRDDWDDDDDEETGEEDPQRLWEEANKRAPMPQVVIANSSTSAAAALSPPPAALQPTLRILKRPSASASSSSGSTSPQPSASSPPPTDASSYAEREARYQAARERIFGEAPAAANALRSTTPASPQTTNGPQAVPTVQIAREPKGPPPSAAAQGMGDPASGDVRGFVSRRGKTKDGSKR